MRQQSFEERFRNMLRADGFDAVLMPAFATPAYRHGQAIDLGVALTRRQIGVVALWWLLVVTPLCGLIWWATCSSPRC